MDQNQQTYERIILLEAYLPITYSTLWVCVGFKKSKIV
jgi:hypothetical protein